MSDADCGAICVRKDVMDNFNRIMEDSRLDANELMEHFFNLYNCCLKLVPGGKSNLTQSIEPLNPQMNPRQMMHHLQPPKQPHRVPNDMKNDGSNYHPGMMYGSVNKTESGECGKNLSMTASNDIMNLGQNDPEDKIQLLQKLRGQTPGGSMSCLNNSQGDVNYSQYKSPYQGGPMAPPSMVPMQDEFSTPPKKKKKKKAKLAASPVPMGPPSEGEDLLKSSMCSLCQATFMRFTDLLAHHKAVHNSDTSHPLRCRACGRTQTSEAGLIYHQVYVCKMVERNHQCQVCGLKFQSESVVLVHKCSGDSRKKYACEFCDHYKTESSSDLEKHMRIHTNDKCYVCKICGFSTAWKKNLKEHMVKHLGLKPYVCDMCGYSTSDRHNLRSHRLKHFQRGEGCQKCGKAECHCASQEAGGSSMQASLPVKKKSKMATSNANSIDSSSSPGVSPATSGEKELECPYPNCVYRTKLDFMMSNHILRHQGGTLMESGQGQQDDSDKNSQSKPSSQYSDASQFLGRVREAADLSCTGNAVPPVSSMSPPLSQSKSPSAALAMAKSQAQCVPASQHGGLLPDWKSLSHPQVATTVMLSPPAQFQPLVQQQPVSQFPAHPVSAHEALSSWPSALTMSHPVVPTALLSNQVAMQMSGQNVVPRAMPVFPNMPN